MIKIGEALVDPSLLTERFSCDLGRCHGACCTLKGGRGAPVTDEEVTLMARSFNAVRKYLPPGHRAVIEERGIVEGEAGSYATVCVDNQACVFVYYDGPIAKCSFERAFEAGETSWRKPLSCHLFPIRVTEGALPELRYERINECAPGRRAGEVQNIPVYEFLRMPIERAFGASWYEELQSVGQADLDH